MRVFWRFEKFMLTGGEVGDGNFDAGNSAAAVPGCV